MQMTQEGFKIHQSNLIPNQINPPQMNIYSNRLWDVKSKYREKILF